ncbi:MAG: L-2-amino-thiazoline-4-carboxylic acid hydrolase [Candidatus Margulisiibacteriota bacterium]
MVADITTNKHLISVGFIKALQQSFGQEEALRIAADGFANYMIEYYKLVLSATAPKSQARFDKFRKHYLDYAGKTDYIKIINSKKDILEVRYDRCPFAELMTQYGLAAYASAFCLSDKAFTEKVLPGVEFIRSHEIVKGDAFCDHAWIFNEGLN